MYVCILFVGGGDSSVQFPSWAKLRRHSGPSVFVAPSLFSRIGPRRKGKVEVLLYNKPVQIVFANFCNLIQISKVLITRTPDNSNLFIALLKMVKIGDQRLINA